MRASLCPWNRINSIVQSENQHSEIMIKPSKFFGERFPAEIAPLATELFERLMDGSICISLDGGELSKEDAERLKVKDFKASLGKLASEGIVSEDPDARVPFILYRGRLYMQRYFRYEREVVADIRRFIDLEGRPGVAAARKDRLSGMRDFVVGHFQKKGPLPFHGPDLQLVAALQAYLNTFTIITGGPGVGKTTSMTKLLSIVLHADPDTKVLLCAPTGKAAQRMKEAISKIDIEGMDPLIVSRIQAMGEKAMTIHKTLGVKPFEPRSPYFRHDRQNPLECDLLIVDECSMIDVALFAKLLSAVPDDARVVLLGDKDQLASVEAASIFGDLCQSTSLNVFTHERSGFLDSFLADDRRLTGEAADDENPLHGHVIELTHSYRFSAHPYIGSLSRSVISGSVGELDTIVEKKPAEAFIDFDHSEQVFLDFASQFTEYVEILRQKPCLDTHRRKAFESFNRFRILVATREFENGLHAVNRRVEQYLLHEFRKRVGGRVFDPASTEFYEFRPVMVTRNNYSVTPALYNGDVGFIARDDDDELKAWFEKDGALKSYPPGQLGKVETNFAQTVHKSQGSEYERVMVILPKSPDVRILTRELLYTGITRAKSHVTLVGSREVIEKTVSRKVQRTSGLQSAWK